MKRLFRSRENKIIGGVCGGLGEYLDVDPVLIRLIWGALFFLGGVGLFGYIIAWLIIPLRYDTTGIQDIENDTDIRTKNNTRLVLGIVLVLAGTMLLARDWWYFDYMIRDTLRIIWRYLIPSLLVAVGIYVIIKGKSEKKNTL
ncbi:MAG: PspC domain-containing protein [Candidatus Marinimicrobia bacterium]|nr:PspC domain-containing protein [Candidatus Neomarinimicrobiota bacterium]